MTKVDLIGEAVLDFYKTLPFNVSANPETIAQHIYSENQALQYPPLHRLALPNRRVLDVGCGGGWLSNTLAYHQKSDVTGIDFNPVAIDFACKVAEELDVATKFEIADLFDYQAEPYDLIASVGVLHHTSDCEGAIIRLAKELLKPGGFIFIGLYHAHGRKPFLEHFSKLKKQGVSDEDLLSHFKAMFGQQAIDDTHLDSWFRDQVLHPHETQHTIADLLPVLETARLELITSSVNGYRQNENIEAYRSQELMLENVAKERILANEYYPGFFTILARKIR